MTKQNVLNHSEENKGNYGLWPRTPMFSLFQLTITTIIIQHTLNSILLSMFGDIGMLKPDPHFLPSSLLWICYHSCHYCSYCYLLLVFVLFWLLLQDSRRAANCVPLALPCCSFWTYKSGTIFAKIRNQLQSRNRCEFKPAHHLDFSFQKVFCSSAERLSRCLSFILHKREKSD